MMRAAALPFSGLATARLAEPPNCHCDSAGQQSVLRDDKAIQPFRQAQGPEQVEGLDRHGALSASR